MPLRKILEDEKKRLERELKESWCVGVHRDITYSELEAINKRRAGLENWRIKYV